MFDDAAKALGYAARLYLVAGLTYVGAGIVLHRHPGYLESIVVECVAAGWLFASGFAVCVALKRQVMREEQAQGLTPKDATTL